MSKAEERALEAYPPKLVAYSDLFGEETLDDNGLKRAIFIEGYQQAEKDLELTAKEVDDSISKFKSLLHLHADMKSTCADGGYAPNLYFFDDSWHVDWISCTEGDSLIDFTDDTPEGAIQKAYEWFHSTFKNA